MSNPPVITKKLGQLLVERGWITGEQLIRAIQSQRVVGGRIGTCLLEMDVLTEDRLLEALSQQLSVPPAKIEELRAIGGGILDLIPSKVASRWQAVPLSADRNDIRVATLNVKNLACLDELEFCSNKRVLPHIANEVRIFEALEKYYGVECPRRYGHLLDRLNRSRYMWDESAKVLLGAGQKERGVQPPEKAPEATGDRRVADRRVADRGARDRAPGRRPTDDRRVADRRAVDRLTFARAADPGEPDLLRPPASRSTLTLGGSTDAEPAPKSQGNGAITWPTPVAGGTEGRSLATETEGRSLATETEGGTPIPATLTLDDVERILAGQSDQKSIGRIILRFLGQSFSRCAIFALRNEGVRGWLYHGAGFDAALFSALDLRLDQPSAFLGLVKGSEFFVGPLAPMPAHRELARCWGGELPQQCLMMPIRLRGRLISVLYADRGARGLEGIQIEEVKELSDKAAIAFELCILRRKLRQRPLSRARAGAD